MEGARRAAALGKPIWGVRLDSGDLRELAQQVRAVLDGAGLAEVKIMATNDLDEDTIRALVQSGAPVDVFGVGTALATSYDAPALGCVYKLVEHEGPLGMRYPAKKSEGKATLPGRKQVFRFPEHDVVGRMEEACPAGAVPLLELVMEQGRVKEGLPGIEAARVYAREQIAQYGKAGRRIEYSEALLALEA